MIDLDNCTLVCIGTQNHALALRAMQITMSAFRFGRALFFTDRMIGNPGNIKVVRISPLASATDCRRLMAKGLAEHIETSHALTVEWDGYVVHPESWLDSFLEYDYLGPNGASGMGLEIGRRGFSLRSKRLLEALADLNNEGIGSSDSRNGQSAQRDLETRFGIRFAPAAVADRFSFEVHPPGHPTLGFQSLANFWAFVSDDELPDVLAAISAGEDEIAQLRVLGMNYLCARRPKSAARVFRRIIEANRADPDLLRLREFAEGNLSAPLAGRNDPCPCGGGRRFKACHGAIASSDASIARPPTSGAQGPRIEDALRYHEAGDLVSAESAYRAVLAIEPENSVAIHFLGVIAYQRNDLETALPLLTRSVALNPHEPNFHNNFALALMAADRMEEAVTGFERVLSLAPEQALTWSNIGLARQALNQLPEAIAAFRQALRLEPGFTRARWNLALVLLLAGQFEEGWSEYEARLSIADLGGKEHKIALPHWDGHYHDRLRLQIQAEQGIGDTLQFVRYLPLLQAQGVAITLACDQALHPLLQSMPGSHRLIARDAVDPACQAQMPLASLPGHFGTRAGNIPAAIPYLFSNQQRVDLWHTRLGPRRGQRVGLVWAGNPAHSNDRNRSIRLSMFESLLEIRGIDWVALQLGEARSQLLEIAPNLRPLDASEHLHDFGDTAALLDALDLLLTVDTSVAHLAGAMGRPAWVLLPYAPDWRWQLGQKDSRWYPTIQLFRQERRGDWSTPIAAVAKELALLRSGASMNFPPGKFPTSS